MTGDEKWPALDAHTDEPPLDRDQFTRRVIGELADVLDAVVGLEDASGLVSVVGRRVGAHINDVYISRKDGEPLDRAGVAAGLVALKRSIHGDFHVIEQDDDRIVLGNHACPFGDQVKGRPALCMMTSNVFGTLASDHLGYSRVELEKTIARGDAGCRVVIHLRPAPDEEAATGLEYFRA
jgi:predicted ArsR family transcriptional regulator